MLVVVVEKKPLKEAIKRNEECYLNIEKNYNNFANVCIICITGFKPTKNGFKRVFSRLNFVIYDYTNLKLAYVKAKKKRLKIDIIYE